MFFKYQILLVMIMMDKVGPYLWEKFSFAELTEIMRQKDYQKFAIAMNNFANYTLTENF